MARKLLFLILFLITVSEAFPEKFSSYEGTHFYVGFMENEIYQDDSLGMDLSIYIASQYDCRVTVKIPGESPWIYLAKKDSVIVVDVPDNIEVRTSEEPIYKAVEIVSELPVTVYIFNGQYQTSDAYSAIPVAYWGNEYVCVSMPNDNYNYTNLPTKLDSIIYLTPRSSEFMVIAAYDNTEIKFTPKAITFNAKQTFREYTVRLDKGQCYLVKSARTPPGTGDLSGTIVRSDKPVGFLSGHVRVAIPYNKSAPQAASKDHLSEMLMPTNIWGKIFISIPFVINPYGDLIKINNIFPNTVVNRYTVNYNQDYFLDSPGDFQEIWRVNEPTLWHSNKPVQISQMMSRDGYQYDTYPFYDPSLVVLPPLEQYVQRILFQTPGDRNIKNEYLSHYISLVVHKDAISSIKFDGILLDSATNIKAQNISGTDYYWETLKVSKGKHELQADSGKFSGVMYGIGSVDSYSMILGSSLNNPFSVDTIPPEIDTTVICGRIEGVVHEVINEKSSGIDLVRVIKDSTYNYKWTIDELTDTSTYIHFYAEPENIFKDGKITFEIRDRYGNGYKQVYYYYAIKLDIPLYISFDKVHKDSVKCYNFDVYNEGSNTFTINDYEIKSDPRLSFSSVPQLPFTILPGEKLSCRLCFSPMGDTTSLYAELYFYTDCDSIKIPVTSKVILPLLTTVGHDFGDVVVGDTKCDSVSITNNGNTPIWVDSLEIPPGSYYDFDTTGFFPYKLYPEETVYIPVCFAPLDTGFSSLTIIVKDNYKQELMITVTGRGISPDIASLTVDWKRRRIGTINDTTVYLKNNGHAAGLITYDSYIIPPVDTNDVNSTELEGINVQIPAEDSLKLNFSYSPADTSDYQVEASYSVDSPIHLPVSIELLGKGTIPVINTYDIYIDTTEIYNYRDTTEPAVISNGNEILTIDSVIVLGGDAGQFIIDYNLLKNLTIPYISPDSILNFSVRYAPRDTGAHKLVLGVVNDAMPNYIRRTDTVNIYGYCIPADTLEADINIEGPEIITACISSDYKTTISNTGNIDLKLNNLQISSDEFDIWFTSVPPQDTILPEDGALYPEFSVRSYIFQSGKVKITADFVRADGKPGTVTVEKEISIIADAMPIILNDFSGYEIAPGDTTTMTFSGSFPAGSDDPVNIRMRLLCEKKSFVLNSYKTDLIVNNNGDKVYYNSTLSQSDNEITITPKKPVTLAGPSDWSISIPLFTLLNTVLQPEFKLNIISDMCFLPDSTVFKMRVHEVCSFPIRPVMLITNQVLMKTSPNPTSDELKVEVFLPEDSFIRIGLYDQIGKNIYPTRNLNLEKGWHSLIFNLNFLNNGIYNVTLRSKDIIKKSMFIISK